MTEPAAETVTHLLAEIHAGDESAVERLLPVVYEELRIRAQQLMAAEKAGHTLQPTALVHEAYLRLVGNLGDRWENRRHFFGAAAEAMRRVLIENARHRLRIKRGGDRKRIPLTEIDVDLERAPQQLIELDDALEALEKHDPRKREVVMLRYFAGLGGDEVADMLGVSRKTVDRDWRYAKAWLFDRLGASDANVSNP